MVSEPNNRTHLCGVSAWKWRSSEGANDEKEAIHLLKFPNYVDNHFF